MVSIHYCNIITTNQKFWKSRARSAKNVSQSYGGRTFQDYRVSIQGLMLLNCTVARSARKRSVYIVSLWNKKFEMTRKLLFFLIIDNNGDLCNVLTKNQHNTLCNSYVQIKTLIKRNSITLATKHTTITTIFKYMLPTTLTSHCTHIDIEVHTQHQEQTPI